SAQIQAADAAILERGTLAQERRDFRGIGARKLFIDGLNQLRREASGDLDKLPGSPDLKDLAPPRAFAPRFFLQGEAASAASLDLDVELEETQRRVDDLKENLAVQEARLKDLQDQKTKRDQEETARQSADAEIAETERRLVDLKSRRAKLG